MNFVLQPWQLLFLILTGWATRRQQELVDYLRTENQVVKEAFGERRIRLTDDQRRRLAVRPGLTCLWQVSGRNQIGFERWMQLDLQYIDQWSLRVDARLLLQTVPVVLLGKDSS